MMTDPVALRQLPRHRWHRSWQGRSRASLFPRRLSLDVGAIYNLVGRDHPDVVILANQSEQSVVGEVIRIKYSSLLEGFSNQCLLNLEQAIPVRREGWRGFYRLKAKPSVPLHVPRESSLDRSQCCGCRTLVVDPMRSQKIPNRCKAKSSLGDDEKSGRIYS